LRGTIKKENIQPGQAHMWFNLALSVKIALDKPGPAWLVYADGYNSMWKATINGTETPVIRANLGFKAILLHDKDNLIEWSLKHGNTGVLSNIVAVFGALSSLGGLIGICYWVRPRVRLHKKKNGYQRSAEGAP
jgi:hypothetical protein